VRCEGPAAILVCRHRRCALRTGRQRAPSVPGSWIRAVNRPHHSEPSIEFTVHIGDIKAGNTLCEDNVYLNNFAYFNSFENPVIFTPGDNEWTDCHRANNGSMDPLDRLLLLRTLFFDGNKSLGQKRVPLFKDRAPYVENSIWRQRPAMFVTLHQSGSNNNRDRKTGLYADLTDSEYAARNESNMEFLDRVFHQAHFNPRSSLS